MIHFTLFKFKEFEVSLLMPFRGFSNKMDWGTCINPILLTKGLLKKRRGTYMQAMFYELLSEWKGVVFSGTTVKSHCFLRLL